MIITIPMQSVDGCVYQPCFVINNGKQLTSISYPTQKNKDKKKLPYFASRKEAINYFKKYCGKAPGAIKKFAQNLIGQKSRYCLGTTDLIAVPPTFKPDRPTTDIQYHE